MSVVDEKIFWHCESRIHCCIPFFVVDTQQVSPRVYCWSIQSYTLHLRMNLRSNVEEMSKIINELFEQRMKKHNL